MDRHEQVVRLEAIVRAADALFEAYPLDPGCFEGCTCLDCDSRNDYARARSKYRLTPQEAQSESHNPKS